MVVVDVYVTEHVLGDVPAVVVQVEELRVPGPVRTNVTVPTGPDAMPPA